MARERPQGGGSRSATHPAYQTALGEGEGGLRLHRNPTNPTALQTELGLSPQPLWGALPLPSDTQRDGVSAGLGGETERKRDGERERERWGEAERGRGRDSGEIHLRGDEAKAHGSEGLDKVN